MANDVDSKSKISIWWDIENCNVPHDVDPHFIAQNLSSALHRANLLGPIEIQVFGDTKILPYNTQKALTDTGITLNHVPRGNKDAADKAIIVAMLLWALDNPPPANILLISGDGDFANALHRLRWKTYKILLACPSQCVKPALVGAAKTLWCWKDLAKGQIAEQDISNTIADSKQLPSISNHVGDKYSASNTCSSRTRRSSQVDINYSLKNLNVDSNQKSSITMAVQARGSAAQNMTESIKSFSHRLCQKEVPKSTLMPEVCNSSFGHMLRGPLQNVIPDRKYNGFVQDSNRLNNFIPVTHIDSSNESHLACLDKVYCAMKTLERDMLAPTEENLTECIRYWDPQQCRTDFKGFLLKAADLCQVTKTQIGRGVLMYFPPDHKVPWTCVDPGNMQYRFTDDIWTELQYFLLYGENKQLFLCSGSRYSAAQILKNANCAHIKDLSIGRIINLLQQAVHIKRWLRKCGPGWALFVNERSLLDYSLPAKVPPELMKASQESNIVWKPVKKPYDKDAILSKLRSLLPDLIKKDIGYDISLLSRDFQLKTGIQLDHEKLGFSSIQELLVGKLQDIVYIEITSNSVVVYLKQSSESSLKPENGVSTAVPSNDDFAGVEYLQNGSDKDAIESQLIKDLKSCSVNDLKSC